MNALNNNRAFGDASNKMSGLGKTIGGFGKLTGFIMGSPKINSGTSRRVPYARPSDSYEPRGRQGYQMSPSWFPSLIVTIPPQDHSDSEPVTTAYPTKRSPFSSTSLSSSRLFHLAQYQNQQKFLLERLLFQI